MQRIAAQHRAVALIACLAVLAGAWLWCGRPTFNSSAWVLMQSDQRNLTTYTELRDSLGGFEIIGAVIDDIDVFSNEGARRLDAITQAMASVDGMQSITSLTTPDRPIRRGLALAQEPFIPPQGAAAEQWAAIEHRVLSNLIAHNVLVSGDGHAAMVLAVSQRQLEGEASRAALREDLLAAVAPFDGVTLMAYSVTDGEIRATARADAMKFVPAAAVVIIAILLVTFRRPRLVVAMLANQAVVLLMLPPLLKAYAAVTSVILGRVMTPGFDLYTNLLLPLTAAIHLALQTHVVSSCLSAPGANLAEKTHLGVRRVTRPTVIAALTTMVGLFSLSFSEIGPVVRFAVVGGLAVTIAAAYTLGPGMALIRFGMSGAQRPAIDPDDTSPQAHAGLKRQCLSRWAGPVALVLLALVPGVAMIRTDVRAIEFLNAQSPTRRAAELIDARFGGINLFMIEFAVDAQGVADNEVAVNRPAVLHLLESKRQKIEQIPGIGTAYDYSQAFSMINRVWHGDDPAYERIPQSPLGHALIAGLLSNTKLPFIEKLRATEGDKAFILVRTASMPSREYLALLEQVMAIATTEVPTGVTVRPRTGLHTVLEQDRRLVADQTRSTLITLAAVLVMVLVVWRSWWLAGAVTAVAALPVLAMLGVAGYTDTSINSVTMMTASIVLGLAVDDGAHLIDAARRLQREGMPWRHAVSAAVLAKRRPIICTSAILGSMLGLMTLSSFPPVQAFGLLACTALIAALAAVLVLLPWLMRVRESAG